MDTSRHGKYNPETFTDVPAGFGWDDRTVLCTDSKFVLQSDGKGGGFASYHFTGLPDGDDKERTQFYSAGSRVGVSEDGEQLIDNGEGFSIPKASDFGKFSAALVNAGMSKADLNAFEDKASALKGKRIHFREMEVIDFRTKKTKTRTYNNAKGQPVTVTETRPFPVSLAKDNKAKAGNGTVAEAIQIKTIDTLVKALTEAGGRLTKQDIQRQILTIAKNDPDRVAMVSIAADNNWLSTDKPWKFDGVAASL